MNRIYRLVWNHLTQSLVAVAECARGRGKRPGTTLVAAAIGAGALVTGGTIIPPGSLVLGSPGKVVKNLSLDEQSKIKSWAEKYVTGSRIYRENHSTLP
jgi:hypothetical protein